VTDISLPRHIERALLAHILTCDPDSLMGGRISLNEAQQKELASNKAKFHMGTPLSRIIGYREFWSLKFFLNDATLDPRPDSETLVECALDSIPKDKPCQILDLGTGTGCLALSVLKERPLAQATLTDFSAHALEQARENAQYHTVVDRCTFIETSWLEGIQGHFDYILSNPPYISPSDYQDLDENVKHYDPIDALVAHNNGLACYQTILSQLSEQNISFNKAFFEIGFDQSNQIQDLITKAGFKVEKIQKDLAHHPRVVILSA
jgi:release factor glutamine methyltransferase